MLKKNVVRVLVGKIKIVVYKMYDFFTDPAYVQVGSGSDLATLVINL